MVSGNGSHTVSYWSTDLAGNAETPKTGYVNIDTVAPVTAAANLQVSNNTGWVNSGQTVTLTPTDTGGSGVASTKYQIDAGTMTTYSVPFVVSGAGSHTITYYSTDAVGNVEATKTGYVNIDLTAPTTAATNLQATSLSGWVNASQTVTLTPTDTGGSGRAHDVLQDRQRARPRPTRPPSWSRAPAATRSPTTRPTPRATPKPPGPATSTSTTAPTTAATNLQVANNVGWTNASLTVTLTPSDTGGSGMATTKYQIDAGTLTTYSAPFLVSGAGSHTITYYSTDAAGNQEATKTGLRQHRHYGADHHAANLQATNNGLDQRLGRRSP